MKADIETKLARLRARRTGGIEPPIAGAKIEFQSDRFTDKGPASGVVVGGKTTVDGYYITVKFADSQKMFSWDDIRDGASMGSSGTLLIKSYADRASYREPTPAQAEAGNYKKPVVKWRGLEIAVENPAGSVRRGPGWETTMVHDYGYVKRSEAVDGDEVDVYLGPQLEIAPMVYVVHQRKYGDWEAYDEDKVMIGFPTEEAAREAYLMHYDDPRFLGPITCMPVDEFVAKVRATKEKPAMIKGIVLFMKANGAPPTPGKVVKEDGKDKIVEDLDGLIGEHEHLVGMLQHEPGAAAATEASEEGAELKGFKRKKAAADGKPMSKAVFLKSDKLSTSMREKTGTVGSKTREDHPPDAFLEPGTRKYPVKTKNGDKWEYSPKLLEAAAARARMQGRDDLAKRADDIRAGL